MQEIVLPPKDSITRPRFSRPHLYGRTLARNAGVRQNSRPTLAFAPAGATPKGDLLISIFLRGAADGLNILVPHGENAYYRLRPTLAIQRPDDHHAPAGQKALDLDGFFGLHPALKPLLPAWQAQQLAFVQACGAPDESRSHFRAMELIDRGIDELSGPASGWLGRHLASLNDTIPSPLRAIGIGTRVPRSLEGTIPTTTLRSIYDLNLGRDVNESLAMQTALTTLYQADSTVPLGLETLAMLRTITKITTEKPDPKKKGPAYPQSELGQGLKQIATLARAAIGLEVACLDVSGWDTHINQHNILTGLLSDLGASLAAFQADMQDRMGHTLVVAMSEFGRRAEENAGFGTDHGHGSMMILLGGGIKGRLVHGKWPGLEDGQLVGPGDLAVTTDYRDVLAELLLNRLHNPRLAEIFPGFTPTFRGLTL